LKAGDTAFCFILANFMNNLRQKMNKLVEKAKFEKTAYLGYFLEKFRNIKEDIKKSINSGLLSQHQVKCVILIFLIVFTGYVILFKQLYYQNLVSFQESPAVIEKKPRDIRKENLKNDLNTLVAGHPIEMMVPYIMEKDRKTAAYLVGIAKKESNWGKRKPVLDGEDCYNYWGFRAKRERMGSGGHTCFDSPEEAVEVVSKRITEIIERNEVESAKDMLVWKCGSSCAATGGQAAANKWAMDVDLYAEKILN
jgi:hypothetical protein